MRITVTKRLIVRIIIIVLVVATAFLLADKAGESEAIRSFVLSYGYLGAFLIAVISGFNLVVPLPAIAFLPLFLESGLTYWGTVAAIVAGVTLADSIAFMIGRMGREIATGGREERLMRRIERLQERYYWAPFVVLFLFASAAPFPNELLVVPMGFLGYRFVHILPALLLGNVMFNTFYAAGILNIFRLFI